MTYVSVCSGIEAATWQRRSGGVNYYNEHDAKAAAWLRQLIADGQIAPGDVDERSIVEVQPADLVGYRQCHFFAGIGGWSYALRLAGWPDDRPVWTGSCPCQPFSSAGQQRGTADERHLWPVWYRLIRECRPNVVFGEQVESAIAHGWLDLVCDDLEREGYAVGATDLGAASVGAFHIRQRLWFVADSMPAGRPERGAKPGNGSSPGRGEAGELGQPLCAGLEGLSGDERDGHEPGRERTDAPRPVAAASASGFWDDVIWTPCRDGKARPVEPGIRPLVDGLPRGLVPSGDLGDASYANATAEARVMRLRGYGNAIVPQVAAEFIGAYLDAMVEAQ